MRTRNYCFKTTLETLCSYFVVIKLQVRHRQLLIVGLLSGMCCWCKIEAVQIYWMCCRYIIEELQTVWPNSYYNPSLHFIMLEWSLLYVSCGLSHLLYSINQTIGCNHNGKNRVSGVIYRYHREQMLNLRRESNSQRKVMTKEKRSLIYRNVIWMISWYILHQLLESINLAHCFSLWYIHHLFVLLNILYLFYIILFSVWYSTFLCHLLRWQLH